ncbi:MAG: hypothetical protein KBD63_04500 [Bacteriovoracaceae bacterium]|nr:hypothetical protein [Bacteriovoracaceae bacterium]
METYDKIEFNAKEIIEGMGRVKGNRRKLTSISLESEIFKELEFLANKKGISYQILMQPLITDDEKDLKNLLEKISF